MTTEPTNTTASHPPALSFIVLMALLMSIVAISIDALLPALGLIGSDYQVTNANHVQYVVSGLFIGLAFGELVAGPLSDAMGRKPVLYIGLALYLAGSVLCFFAPSFDILLFGRLLQGIGVAGPYVSTVSIVRDQYRGREMARVMSIIMMIFILVPAVAPALGQGVLHIASWRYIFLLYIVYSIAIVTWIAFRLNETLPKERRIAFKASAIRHGFIEVFTNRITMSYMLAIGACFGGFLGYLNSSQQIFQVQFGTAEMFTVYFGMLALVLGAASLYNSRIVERLGMRYICMRAMIIVVAASILFLGLHAIAHITLWMFLIYAAIIFFGFGLMFGNLNAIAMEPMGRIAGTAAAVIGAVSSLMSMALGTLIGQLYDNTLIPMTVGFIVLGLVAIGCMVYGNRGHVSH